MAEMTTPLDMLYFISIRVNQYFYLFNSMLLLIFLIATYETYSAYYYTDSGCTIASNQPPVVSALIPRISESYSYIDVKKCYKLSDGTGSILAQATSTKPIEMPSLYYTN